MSGYSNSPKLVNGGLVVLDAATGAVKRTIALQYNPDTLTHSYQVQGAGGEGGAERAQPFRLKGPAIASIKLEAEIDATDSLEHPDQNANAVAFGIAPQLAALESLVNPSTAELLAVNALSQSGTLEILPPEAPLVLFVWGALTHVIQQGHRGPALRRDVRGPKATATLVDWKDKVAKTTAAADRAALVQSVVAPVNVVDKTADAAADAAVNPKNCIEWHDTNPMVSYDDGLNAKKGRAANVGFTKEVTTGPTSASKTEFYIVLGPKALDAKGHHDPEP